MELRFTPIIEGPLVTREGPNGRYQAHETEKLEAILHIFGKTISIASIGFERETFSIKLAPFFDHYVEQKLQVIKQIPELTED